MAKSGDAPSTWAIVLAGGEGMRLRSLVREVFGQNRPKQYVRLLGARTLLGQTLDRVGLGIAACRTIVVTAHRHAGYMGEELTRSPYPHVLVQPCDRGTAAAVLYPAHWIAWRNPEATVAIFPSDHYIADGAAFMAHVARASEWVDRHPDRLVVLAVPPTAAESAYGWIEPGKVLSQDPAWPIRAVRQFQETPSPGRAQACLDAGHLWNTSVLVGKVAHVLSAGWLALPEMSDRLAHLEPFSGTEDEAGAARQAYELMTGASFSRAVLQVHPDALAVYGLPPLAWADLGSPDRVLEVVARMRTPPPWAEAVLPRAGAT